jgi:hypothetical protein
MLTVYGYGGNLEGQVVTFYMWPTTILVKQTASLGRLHRVQNDKLTKTYSFIFVKKMLMINPHPISHSCYFTFPD